MKALNLVRSVPGRKGGYRIMGVAYEESYGFDNYSKGHIDRSD